MCGPFRRILGERREPCAYVLAALRIVRRERGHRCGESPEHPLAEVMKLFGIHANAVRVGTHLVDCEEPVVPVESCVLKRFRVNRPARLSETRDKLRAQRIE